MPSGQPSESPSDMPSSEPSETPSCTPSQAPTPSPSVNLFYPDQTSGSNGCLNDGAQPAWMEQNPTTWLFSTLDKCCSTHFSWNYGGCMGTLDDTCARAYWYPDWEGANEGCVRDGNEPTYMTDNPTHYFFNTKADCCDEHYSWNKVACMGGSSSSASGAGSGTSWYADWTSGDETCKNDGNAPDYMVNNPTTWLYTTQESCCDRYFSYQKSDCMGTSAAAAASGKFYPDWAGSNEGCLEDTASSPAPDYMAGSTTWLFDTLDACCEQHYSWAEASCKGSSATAGTDEWYVVWDSPAKCVKNCATGSGTGCGGLAETWDTLYSSQQVCCNTRVSYAYKDCMA